MCRRRAESTAFAISNVSAANRTRSPGSTFMASYLRVNLVAQELDDGALLFAVGGVGNPSHALRAIGGSDVGQLVDVATAPVASALRVDGLHDIASLDSLGEYAEAAATHDLGKVNELHAKADVGAVATKAVHGLFPRHALQREFVLDASGLENFL